MQHNKYLHIITGFFGATWAIIPEKLDAMIGFLRFAAHGGKYSAEEVAERIGPKAAAGSVSVNRPTTIAVIPIQGIIDQKAARVEDISGPGGTSTEKTLTAFRAALNDESVKAIAFDIDSPGGTIYGVPELAEEIFKARGKKPIVAVVNSLAASAAYWLASAADEIVITPSGETGSIGVYAMHTDVSEWLKMEGTKVTLIKAGEFKAEANPYEPLSEEAAKHIQGRVDEYYSMFTKAVARGRGVPVSKVKSDFGKGRVLGADEAVKVGMADRIATFDQAIEKLAGPKKKSMTAEDQGGTVHAEEQPAAGEEERPKVEFLENQIASSPAAPSALALARRRQEQLEAGLI